MEEAHLEPDLFIFHDVMSDQEIETIKRLAQPRVSFTHRYLSIFLKALLPILLTEKVDNFQFRRATVQNSQTGALETAQYRISKSAWLKNEEHKHIANVARRVEDMTGLSMETAEELQVVNYGIGGHYEPHFDFARVSCFG